MTLRMQDVRLGLQLQPQKNTKLHPWFFAFKVNILEIIVAVTPNKLQ